MILAVAGAEITTFEEACPASHLSLSPEIALGVGQLLARGGQPRSARRFSRLSRSRQAATTHAVRLIPRVVVDLSWLALALQSGAMRPVSFWPRLRTSEIIVFRCQECV